MENGKITIEIDGRSFDVVPGKNLLETCLALGFDLPYFCYHPAMGSVGACRQCAVKKFRDPADRTGKIIMSCMEPVTDGMIISVEDPEAKAFRASIIESLMTNHPHDCPVCDEGGECHLQDMTVMTGHDYRRYRFPKRTYKNQYLGPFISHEMNRCIQCYRCVRFYRDHAGGRDLNVFAAHDHVYFGRWEEGTLESEFSGNLVEVCPTGVFTDKTHWRHYTRKWDLSNAPSVCVHCSLGCNIIAGERYGSLRRIMSRYNGSVNGYFICDRGRFGYEFVNSGTRLGKVPVRGSRDQSSDEPAAGSVEEALSAVFAGSRRILGIGSPRASLEANFALSVLVGKENFFSGFSASEHLLVNTATRILKEVPCHSPTLKEIEKADAVLILGEDVTNTAPMMALAVRQAARTIPLEIAVRSGIPEWNDSARRDLEQDLKSPVFIASSFSTRLDDIAERTFYASPADIARLGFAIANCLDPGSPSPPDHDKETQDLAQKIAASLKGASNPVIITGTHAGTGSIMQAAANIAAALSSGDKPCNLGFVFPECNSMGVAMMEGKSLDGAFDLVNHGEADTVIILENDLYRRADRETVDSVLSKCKSVIVLDHLGNDTTLKADILLPVGTWAESEGTLVSNEGRAQRFYRVFPHDATVPPESWRQIRDMAVMAGKINAGDWQIFDDVAMSMTSAVPALAGIMDHIPGADFRMLNEKIRRQTARFSGRTAINAGKSVSEPGPPGDPDSPLAFSMEGSDEKPASSLVPFYWEPGWNSYQAMNSLLDEPGGHMKGGDPGIRLIGEAEAHKFSYYQAIPDPYVPVSGNWLIVPVYRIFGSEELSSHAEAIAGIIPGPFILLNHADAAGKGAAENEIVKVTINGNQMDVTVMFDDGLPPGIAGLAAGFPDVAYADLPGTGAITRIDKMKSDP